MVAYHEWCAFFPGCYVNRWGAFGYLTNSGSEVVYYRDASWTNPETFVGCNMIAGAEKI